MPGTKSNRARPSAQKYVQPTIANPMTPRIGRLTTQMSQTEQIIASAMTGTPTRKMKSNCPISTWTSRARRQAICCFHLPSPAMQ